MNKIILKLCFTYTITAFIIYCFTFICEILIKQPIIINSNLEPFFYFSKNIEGLLFFSVLLISTAYLVINQNKVYNIIISCVGLITISLFLIRH